MPSGLRPWRHKLIRQQFLRLSLSHNFVKLSLFENDIPSCPKNLIIGSENNFSLFLSRSPDTSALNLLTSKRKCDNVDMFEKTGGGCGREKKQVQHLIFIINNPKWFVLKWKIFHIFTVSHKVGKKDSFFLLKLITGYRLSCFYIHNIWRKTQNTFIFKIF